jgi:F-box-like
LKAPVHHHDDEIRRLLSIDWIAGRPRLSTRTTPSQKRHINTLPPEILIIIFQNGGDLFAWRRPDPVVLSLVCRFWHAIVTGCPNLWTNIVFEQSKGFNSALERTLARAGTASISLKFCVSIKLYPHDEERILRLFSRCHELWITIRNETHYTFPSSITMPYLEHIKLAINKGTHTHVDPLLDSIEKRSPRLRLLSISGFFPTNLARHRSLLRRIARCDLTWITNDEISPQGFENLEELG